MSFSSAILPSSSRVATLTSFGNSRASNLSESVSLKSVTEVSVRPLDAEAETDEAGHSKSAGSSFKPFELNPEASSIATFSEMPRRMLCAVSKSWVRS